MIKKSELLSLIMDNSDDIMAIVSEMKKLEKRVKALEPKKERKSAKKVSK